MIINERYAAFINSMDMPEAEFLEEIYLRAKEKHVPVIRRELQSFLKVFIELTKPDRILEVGAGVGFSSLLMAEYAPESCSITTIENYEKRFIGAKKNIESSPHAGKIKLIFGDASNVLKELSEKYDFIFLDAAKGQYINFLPQIKRLLKEGGALISDNVLQDGNIIESRYIVERRDRTIHKRMREYLYKLKHDEDFATSVIPIGDGITLSVKLRREGFGAAPDGD